MLVVLVAAGAFVFWRVQLALDNRLNEDLRTQTGDLRVAAMHRSPESAITSIRDAGRDAQILGADGAVLASGPALRHDQPLLTQGQARRARGEVIRSGRGYLFSKRGEHLRILAVPVRGRGPAAVAVSAVRLDQRDEALRELLAQLAIANVLALALASAVGHRLARGALDPVERYRAQTEQIAQGHTGVRLEVPDGPVDEVTRLGATLNAMLDAQERAVARQQQFIDDASHELRTPLSTLSAEIDLALRKPRSANEHEATLRRLATDTTQLVELAETLLALGGLGSSAPAARPLDARELIDAAARRARAQLVGDRAAEARTEDLVVYADAGLLSRALGNLVDNAVRHGDGTITIEADAIDASSVVLTVHDEGPGIPIPYLPHATERFSQQASSRTRPGAGLGLSLVDSIVTAHHGQLRICSAHHHHHQPTPNPALKHAACTHPDNGTTISLLLPSAVDPRASGTGA